MTNNNDEIYQKLSVSVASAVLSHSGEKFDEETIHAIVMDLRTYIDDLTLEKDCMISKLSLKNIELQQKVDNFRISGDEYGK